MTKEFSEYQTEYCGLGDKISKRGASKSDNGTGLVECSASEDIQPIGGRVQEKYRQEVAAKTAVREAAMNNEQMGTPGTPPTDTLGKSMYLSDYITAKTPADNQRRNGVYRMVPQWSTPSYVNPETSNGDPLLAYKNRMAPVIPDFDKRRYMYGTYGDYASIS